MACLSARDQSALATEDANFDGAVHIVLLHVNDSHGHVEPWNKDGKSVGGYSRLSTAVEAIRVEKADRTFLLHAGDEFSKGDDLTTFSLGAANVSLMNHLKFDAFTPGNGEFYFSVEILRRRMSEANFPFLAANVFVKATGEPVGKPYVIETVGQVKVAFFGLCYLRTALPSAWPLRVDDPLETAKKLVPELRKKADVVVALTHLGEDEDRKIAAAVEGIDVIIGGHFHTVMPHGETVTSPDGRSVLICQAGDYLRYLGRVDLAVRPAANGGRVENHKAGEAETAQKIARNYRVTFAGAQLLALDRKVKCDPRVTAIIAAMAGKFPPAGIPASQSAAASRP